MKRKKVRVRIAVGVAADATWSAAGWSGCDDPEDMMAAAVECLGSGERRYWVEAELEVPDEITVQGTVRED